MTPARRLRACLWILAFAPLAATAESRDIRERLLHVAVSAVDRDGRTIEGDIPVTVYRPDGDGPFPLVVISHGRAADPAKRAEPKIQRFESAARFFVRKGFAVAVPTRLGYGETIAAGDPERFRGSCDNADYVAAMEAGASEVLAVVARLRQESWVDARRLLLVGQSVGGFVTTAATAARPPGLFAAINFAGGSGGDPVNRPGQPCAPDNLGKAYASFGARAAAPMLWIYTENDHYFDPRHSRAWHAAFSAAGGQAEYRLLPPFGEDGHSLFARGNDLWQPLVDAFLTRFGYSRPGVLSAEASGFAALEASGSMPGVGTSGQEGYRAFLAAKSPRAFAIGERGGWGWASGDDSRSRALASCQGHDSTRCRLYAVDQAVVWRPQTTATAAP